MDVGLLHGSDHEVRPRSLGVRGYICTQFPRQTENDGDNIREGGDQSGLVREAEVLWRARGRVGTALLGTINFVYD